VAEDGSISDFEMASPEGNEVCSYLSLETGKCECYDDRHFYCAIYFKVEGHPPCNRGLRPDKPIPAAEGREMVKIYKWLIEQKCTE
jgi:Fe-S-cluster containining protein